MGKRLIIAVFTLLLTCQFSFAQTTGLKIGYADVDYILSQMPEAKQIEADYKAYEKQLSNQLQTKMTNFQTSVEDFQANVETMIPEVRADRQREIEQMRAGIQQFQQEAEVLLQRKRAQLLEPAYDKIQAAIDGVAQENGYDYIMSPNVGGLPILLYVKDQEKGDISDMVLRKMGVEPKKETAESGNN